ncbi:MAG TPA: hypothetical protein ENK83_08675, partial [Aliiroseovarius sp.]|nr:hypothetical protein [Aliiroseovarius sp.]
MGKMTETQSAERARLAKTENEAAWLDLIEDVAEDMGWFEPLGPKHSALFTEGKGTLLVTFEQMNAIRACEERVPTASRMSGRDGWASLCLMAHART